MPCPPIDVEAFKRYRSHNFQQNQPNVDHFTRRRLFCTFILKDMNYIIVHIFDIERGTYEICRTLFFVFKPSFQGQLQCWYAQNFVIALQTDICLNFASDCLYSMSRNDVVSTGFSSLSQQLQTNSCLNASIGQFTLFHAKKRDLHCHLKYPM